MNKRLKNVVCLAAIFASSIFIENAFAADRISGEDRYDTAIQISKKAFESSKYVVILNGESFADGVCAAPLAKKLNAPMLIVEKGGMRDNVLSEIKRLNPENIIVIGGKGVVSETVENKLSEVCPNVRRISGEDRYETSLQIAKEFGDSKEVFVATGADYADALSAAPIASMKNVPILLTEDGEFNGKINDYIKSKNFETAYLMGGEAVVSKNIEQSFKNFKRFNGEDRFDTNAKLIDEFSEELNFKNVYVALGEGEEGNGFADAMVGAAVVSKDKAPLILSDKSLNLWKGNEFKGKIYPSTNVKLLGGEAVVSSNVEDILKVSGNIYNKEIKDKVEGNLDVNSKEEKISDINVKGNLYINEDKVVLSNANVEGTIFINPGEKGNAVFENVKAKNIVVLSGDVNSITFNNVKADYLKVSAREKVRVKNVGNTEFNKTEVSSSAILDKTEGDFGNINIIKDRKKQIQLVGNFEKEIRVNENADIKLSSESKVSKLIVDTKKENNSVKLDGNFKEIVVNKPCNLDLNGGTVEKLTAASSLNLTVSKDSTVKKLEDTNNKVNISGEGKVNKDNNTTKNEDKNSNNSSSTKDKDDNSNNSNNGTDNNGNKDNNKPKIFSLEGNKFNFNYEDKNEKCVTVVIFNEKGEVKYIDEIRAEDGMFKFSTVFDKGNYKGTAKGINTSNIMELNFNVNQ